MMAPRAQNEDGTITIVDPSELPEPESKALFTDDMSSPDDEDNL